MTKRSKTTASATQAKGTATTVTSAKRPTSRDKTPAGHRTERDETGGA